MSACNMEKAYLVVKSLLNGSGAPPKVERQAIKQREEKFFEKDPKQTIMIYAVYRFKEGKDCANEELTKCLVQKFKKLGFDHVKHYPSPASFDFTPQPNEMAVFWERAKALSKAIEQEPIVADTVLMLDIFASWNKDYVYAVHAVGGNQKGEINYIGFWNSHQPLYKQLQPSTIEDAVGMLVVDLKRKMHFE